MSFNTKLLLEHIEVPFIPTLGAVHPYALKDAINGIISVANTGNFLPYDKEQRWHDEKKETVLIDYIYQDKSQTIIPTLAKGQNIKIKYYYYSVLGLNNAILQDLQNKILNVFPEASKQVLHFAKDKNEKYSSVLLIADIKDLDIKPQKDIFSLRELPESTAKTLANLARDEDNAGFAFLWERFKSGYNDGNILVSVKDNIIVGALGPLKVTEDAAGRLTRFPPYFGVIKSARKLGIGKALWHTGLSWSKDNSVEYIIIQAQYGSPAEAFYKNMGLKELGGIIRY